MTSGTFAFNYGATGGVTPNVVVAYSDYGSPSEGPLIWYPSGYSGLTNIVYPNSTTGMRFTFTADSGYTVSLSSFHLGAFTDQTLPAGGDGERPGGHHDIFKLECL
jgi:hypothetical protein